LKPSLAFICLKNAQIGSSCLFYFLCRQTEDIVWRSPHDLKGDGKYLLRYHKHKCSVPDSCSDAQNCELDPSLCKAPETLDHDGELLLQEYLEKVDLRMKSSFNPDVAVRANFNRCACVVRCVLLDEDVFVLQMHQCLCFCACKTKAHESCFSLMGIKNSRKRRN